jgi:hypothetical protein
MKERDHLESMMQTVVSNRSGRGIVTVQDKVEALIDSYFHAYVEAQHKLFTDAGLFAPLASAHHTVTS